MPSMTKKLKKRFIAGAVCPKCQAMDTLMLYFENNVEKLECVECGHHDTQSSDQVEARKRATEQMIGLFKPE